MTAPRPHSPQGRLSVPGATVDFLPDRKVPPVPTTTTSPRPDVPLPPGVTGVDDWQADERQPYRVVFGEYRGVTDHPICVSTAAVQWADGSLDDGQIEAPNMVLLGDERSLNSDQARELAAALLAAAAELDRWSGR
jgi:hypothetical protein